jgi:hypothetical protein
MHPILLLKGARIGLRYLRKRGYGKRKDEAPGELSATGSYPAKLQIKLSVLGKMPFPEKFGYFRVTRNPLRGAMLRQLPT